jgi:hypothetical protein
VRRLESLGEGTGAQVLLDLAPHAGDRAAADSLSSQRGRLPLALHLAGSYLASPFAKVAEAVDRRSVANPAQAGRLLKLSGGKKPERFPT